MGMAPKFSGSRYCMFCRRSIVKGEHSVGIPLHIKPEELAIWESASGLQRDELREHHRFHISHFDEKFLSPTSQTRLRLLPGAIPTFNVSYVGGLWRQMQFEFDK